MRNKLELHVDTCLLQETLPACYLEWLSLLGLQRVPAEGVRIEGVPFQVRKLVYGV